MKIGEIILQRRKELGMTQKTLAERLNVTDRSVSRWECGVNLPDVETLKTIAKVLEVPVSYFYEDVKEKEINYTEEYDYERIKHFKLRSIAPVVLLILSSVITFISDLLIVNAELKHTPSFSLSSNFSVIMYGFFQSIEFKIALVAMIMSLILIMVSLVLYTKNTVEFKCFYREKMFQEAYVSEHKHVRLLYILWICIAVLSFSL